MLFLYPVPKQSRISATFAQHIQRGGGKYNGGIDWAVSEGTPVMAAQGGKVVAARFDSGYGEHVRIDHGLGYLTIYGHLLDIYVEIGSVIHAGDPVGCSGNTGDSSGPHLHFELRRYNTAIDPMPLMTTEIDYDPTLPPPPAPQMPPIPAVKIITPRLWIREGPGVTARKVASLEGGTVVNVIEIVNDSWARIGHRQFIALQDGGEVLAVWR